MRDWTNSTQKLPKRGWIELPMILRAIARVRAAEQRAKSSAEEAGLADAPSDPPPSISPELKQAYRQAAKVIHPDLALSDHERKRRTALMASLNRAYERGDQREIERIVAEFGHDPEAIVGEDTASRIVKAIRRIAQLRRRLAELERSHRSSPANHCVRAASNY